MTKNEIRLLAIDMANWFLPPKLKEGLLYLRRELQKGHRKAWKIRPIDTGLHFLKNLKNCEAKKYWLDLKGEVRAGIIIDDKIEFSISGEYSDYEYLQIGFGKRKSGKVRSIKVFLNDVLCGHIENLSDNTWHDLRLKLNKETSDFRLRIKQSERSKLYISHPIFARKKEPDKHTKPRRSKNVICLIVDAINFKYLKLHGEEIAPSICKFFENGMFCNQAFTQADWTLPAFSSMLTSLHVSRHGVSHPGPNDFSLSAGLLTLPELMLKRGYRTYAHSGHNRFNPAYGHAKGFERFIFRPFSNEPSYIAIQDVIFHLDAHKDEHNFIMMHVFDTHPPYKPSSYLTDSFMGPFRDEDSYSKVRKNDDARIDNMLEDEFKAKLKEFDISIANLFSYLEDNNMVDDTLVIFTTDHGLAHRSMEKPRLLNERIHAPLLVRGPNIPKGEENSLIENTVDLMPSVLHCANIDIPDHIDGRIWPFLGGKARGKVISESLHLDKYAVVIKDNTSCYHLSYPFNASTRTIDLKKRSPIIFYKREKFFDVEEDVGMSEKDMLKIYDETERMHLSSRKYY